MFIFYLLNPETFRPRCVYCLACFVLVRTDAQTTCFTFFFPPRVRTAALGFPKYFYRIAVSGRTSGTTRLPDPTPPTGFMAAESFKRNGDGGGDRGTERAVNLLRAGTTRDHLRESRNIFPVRRVPVPGSPGPPYYYYRRYYYAPAVSLSSQHPVPQRRGRSSQPTGWLLERNSFARWKLTVPRANRGHATVNGDISVDGPCTRASEFLEGLRVRANRVEIARFSFSPRLDEKNTRIESPRGFERDRRRASDVRFTRLAARYSNVTIGVVMPSVLTDDPPSLYISGPTLALELCVVWKINGKIVLTVSLFVIKKKKTGCYSLFLSNNFWRDVCVWASTKCLGVRMKTNRQRFSVDTSMFVLDLSVGKSFSTKDLDFYINNYQATAIKRSGAYTLNATHLQCKVYTILRFCSITSLQNLFARYLKSINNIPKLFKKLINSKYYY